MSESLHNRMMSPSVVRSALLIYQLTGHLFFERDAAWSPLGFPTAVSAHLLPCIIQLLINPILSRRAAFFLL